MTAFLHSLPSPHTTVVLAMSADGKIADHARSAARFSSSYDLQHLERQMAQADAVLMGSGTLRAYGTTLTIRQPALLQQRQQQQKPPQPLNIVWSPSGDLDRQWRFFQQAVPRALITTPAGAERWQVGAEFESIWTLPQTTAGWDWQPKFQQLRQAGINHLAVLGGGRLIAALLEQGLVDALVLTVCPLVLGGATAPTPVDGEGFLAAQAPHLMLEDCQVVGQEVYLRYRVERLPRQGAENSITLGENRSS